MGRAEDMKNAYEWSKKNPDNPKAKQFFESFPDYEPPTPVDKLFSSGRNIGEGVLDYVIQAGTELFNQPGYGYDTGTRDLANMLGSDPAAVKPLPGDRPAQTVPGKVARFGGEMLSGEPIMLGMGKIGQKSAEIATGQVFNKMLGTKIASKAYQKAAKMPQVWTEAIWPYIASTLSGVSEDAIQYAKKLEKAGKSIFKGDFVHEAWNDIAERMIRGVKKFEDDLGQAVQAGKNKLRKSKSRTNTDEYQDMILDHIRLNTSPDGVTVLEPDELKKLDELMMNLQGAVKGEMGIIDIPTDMNPHVYNLQIAKERIDNYITYPRDHTQRFNSATEGFLAHLRGNINNEIAKYSPDLAKANKKYSEFQRAKKTLATNLKDSNAVRGLQKTLIYDSSRIGDIIKPDTGFNMKSAMEFFDKNVDDAYKFAEDAKRQGLREEFEHLAPGKPGGSASRAGGLQHARQMVLGHAMGSGVGDEAQKGFGDLSKFTARALVPFFSPKTHKHLIQARHSGIPALIQAYESRLPKAGQNVLQEVAPKVLKRIPKAKILNEREY